MSRKASERPSWGGSKVRTKLAVATRPLALLATTVTLIVTAGTPAVAERPSTSTDEFSVTVVNTGCGFPVEVAVHAFDRFTDFYRDDQLVRFTWHRSGTVTYTNLDTGTSLSGTLRRELNRVIDNTGTVNPDGSTTFTDTDHGIRILATVPSVGTFRQVIGVTDLTLTVSPEGEILDGDVLFQHGLNNPELVSPRLCDALSDS